MLNEYWKFEIRGKYSTLNSILACSIFVSEFDCVWPLNKQKHTSFTVHTVGLLTVVRKTTQCTQSNAWHNTIGQTGYGIYVVTACHGTDSHAHESNDCYSLPVLLLRVWDWWILNDIQIALCIANLWYRHSIKYCDTRDGIVIVALISGITQH